MLTSQAIPVPTVLARVRLQAVEEAAGVHVSVFLDTDLDGLWDITADGLTTTGIGTSGTVGICAYQNAMADEFRYFAGTLAAGAPPIIGTSVALNGRGTPNILYVGACSAGHMGFVIPGGVIVPLDVDPLFNLSLMTPSIFQNFSAITAGDGSFTMTLNIPAIPGLVGATVWFAAVTFDGMAFPRSLRTSSSRSSEPRFGGPLRLRLSQEIAHPEEFARRRVGSDSASGACAFRSREA